MDKKKMLNISIIIIALFTVILMVFVFVPKNKKFSKMNEKELKTVYTDAKSVLEKYYKATLTGNKIDFSKYLSDKNLIKYMDIKLKTMQLSVNEFKVKKEFSDLTVELIDKSIEDKRLILYYKVDLFYKESGKEIGITEFVTLIIPEENKSKIADWYAINQFDVYTRGKDLDLTEDKNQIEALHKQMLEKAEEFYNSSKKSLQKDYK